LVGRNLNNELTAAAGNDIALNNAARGVDFGHARFISPPRSVFITGSYYY